MTDVNFNIFLNTETLSQKIEEKVYNEGCTYFTAVIEFAEDCDKSPEELLPYMSQVLKDKVKKSANDMGLINTGEVDIENLL